MVKISKSGHIITLIPKIFSDGRISQFSNINPHCDVFIPILLKVHIDLFLIFLPQMVFDISVWFHSEITLILLSTLSQDMQIWAFFDPILAIITSEVGSKFQN